MMTGAGALPRIKGENVHRGPLRYRTRPNKTFTILWAAGIPSALFLLEIWTDDHPHSIQTSITVLMTALFLYILWSTPRTFTHIDNNGISLRSSLRTRRLDWADVYDLRTVTTPTPTEPTADAYSCRT
ncbi:hypothetical protein ADK52_22525 [Streptomyces sp. WM6372]|nr:hypothetical protein ADK52_22525 [Streptomyces sp. WM6372]